ncbi:MAG: hypothetical protein JXA67_11530 [Micromonosporaceae bacterium]|nr:hypothetical protein [Micromonosporaceae bacterium]
MAGRHHRAAAGLPLLGARSVEEAVFGGYRTQIERLRPGCPPPALQTQHAKSLGFDVVVLFLDELVLWLSGLSGRSSPRSSGSGPSTRHDGDRAAACSAWGSLRNVIIVDST